MDDPTSNLVTETDYLKVSSGSPLLLGRQAEQVAFFYLLSNSLPAISNQYGGTQLKKKSFKHLNTKTSESTSLSNASRIPTKKNFFKVPRLHPLAILVRAVCR